MRKEMELLSMKKSMKNTIALFLVSALLIAGVMVAGCTQDIGSAPNQASGDQVTPSNAHPVAGDGTGKGIPFVGNGTAGSNRLHRDGNFLSNISRLTAAAATLGVSEQDLQNALNSSIRGRQNLTAAAQQLGVTSDQLIAALGIPAGGPGIRGGQNATAAQTVSI